MTADVLNIANSYSKYHLVLSEVRVIMFIYSYCFYYFEHVHFISFFLIIKHIFSVTNVWTLSHVSMAACFMISVANMIQLIRRMTMDRLGLLCRNIYENNKMTQRELAAAMDLSLGTCNHLVKDGLAQELFTFDPAEGTYSLLKGGVDLLRKYRMDSAVILAAGFGSRFVPLTFETPKGLLEVYGERMIERQIKQLHEAGVTDITIVVGYLKEKFEYLIDKFGVKLLYNPEYHNKNTLTTLYRARECC